MSPSLRPSLCLFAVLVALPVLAQTATTAAAVTTPFPTTQGISIEWAISGDSNLNSVVAVRYRKTGATGWTVGPALFRVPAGQNPGTFGSGNGAWGNKHSGSLFALEAGTTYELELTLTDPEGGSATQTVTAATRPDPVAAAAGVVRPVTPATLLAALAAANPGDVFVLAAGTYSSFTVTRDGTATLPIVIRGSAVDGVTVSGRVTMSNRQFVYLENLTINGEVRMYGARNTAVRSCKVRTMTSGITFLENGVVPRNITIVDNDVVGAAVWADAQLGVNGFNGGEGIQGTGSGHVICNNHVRGFRDDISLMEYGEAFEQTSIDICNNDLEVATDDAIEADSAMGNVRVVRNRVKNCFIGFSSQPGLGGPTYFLGNVLFNTVLAPFKLNNRTVGDVVVHNTVIKCGDGCASYAGAPISRAFYRNNLCIGGMGGGTYGGFANGNGKVMSMADADSTCSFDYDGFASIGTNTFAGRIGPTNFSSLATMLANTTENHAVQVDLSVFAIAPVFPISPFPEKATVDLRLSAGSAAVDKGVALPGLNDGFTGTAPDLGAHEFGFAPPDYGPRDGGAGGGTASGGGAGGSGGGAGASGGGAGASGGGAGASGGGAGSSGGGAGSSGGGAGTSGGGAGTSGGGAGTSGGGAGASGGGAGASGGGEGTSGSRVDAGLNDGSALGPSCGCLCASMGQAWWLLLAVVLRRTSTRQSGRSW